MDREEGELLARFGVPPRQDDLPENRRLLEAETQLERDSDERASTLVMKELCFLLFTARHCEDALLIWRAKRASFDAECSIDIQLLCGAGFAETLRFLRSVDSAEARDTLDCILSRDAAGDFDGHDAPGGRLSRVTPEYLRYYGLTDGDE
jgi:hypothetical protein